MIPAAETMNDDRNTPIQPTWEMRDDIGILPSLWTTLLELNIHPKTTFSAMPIERDWQGPALFAVITSVASFFLTVILYLGIFIGFYIIENHGKVPDFGTELKVKFLFTTAGVIPLLAVYGATLPFLYGIFTHLFLILCRRTTAGWLGSYRACFYAWGAAAPFLAIPTCVPTVFVIALYRSTYYALREVHHVPLNTAIAGTFYSLFIVAVAALGQLGAALALASFLFRS